MFRIRHGFTSGILLAILLLPLTALAQSPGPNRTGLPSLHGQVLDPSGAAVPAMDVHLAGPGGVKLAQTDDQGKYAFRNLAAGTYTLTIQLKGFDDIVKPGIVITRGQAQVVNAQLVVSVSKQQITVTDETNKVDTNPEDNASALTIGGNELEALSDDPDELQSELEALAGPSAGPNGGQIYVDGFTGGQIPPKSSIREIRVNQNPFSAQYDALGYGRVEILTKPGTDNYHGQVNFTLNDSAFNTRNPFATEIPAYHTLMFDGNFGGPINKKTSFFIDGQRRNIQDDAIVDAVVLDPNFNPLSLSQAVPTPKTRTNIVPRLDTQIGNKDTLSFRYALWDNSRTDPAVGQFTLPTAGYDDSERWQSLAVTDSHVLNAKAVMEIRFRYGRDDERQTPASSLPSITVLGAFTGGGTTLGATQTTMNSYQFQDYTSVSLARHFIRFGVRVRDDDESFTSNANFNGSFTFPSIAAYQITQQGLSQGLTPAQIRADGGGASQFQLTAGTPEVGMNYFDIEPYVEDDWKIRQNLTLSGGLRLETQNHISDHADIAPRLGISWGIGHAKSAKTVLRAGYGVFYDRFQDSYILNAERLNGVNQQQFIVASPDFYPNIPPVGMLPSTPTIYQIDPHLRTPLTSQGGIGIERQLSKAATFSVTYLNTRGTHQLISRNINAPDPANPGDARPNPSASDLYQYESAGVYNQNQMIANFNVHASKVSLFGFYTLSFANSDTPGSAAFPMNQYDLSEDYGRAAYDVRHRLFLGGSWNLPRGFQIFPFIVASSAAPFDITVGQDLNGDSIYNDRPAFASSLSNPANVVSTRWGTFDTVPVAGERIIPNNYGTGYGQFTTNLRLSKSFGFGREVQSGNAGGSGGSGGHGGHGVGSSGLSSNGGIGSMFNRGNTTSRRFNLTFSVSARNLLNSVNYAPPVNSLSSPLFGHANALAGGFYSSNAANRRIDLQVRFSF